MNHPQTPSTHTTGTPNTRIRDIALVFEGGAMRAVYSAAVVQALVEAGLDFEWVCGNSASTAHMLYYIMKDPARIRHLYTDFAQDPNFGGLRTWLRGKGFFNADYIFGQAGTPGHPLQLDWEAFRATNTRFRMSGFNPASGQTRHWGFDDIHSSSDFFLHARASATLPLIMPPVIIDGEPWYDGAFGPTGGIPLDAAQEDGFTKFVFILTRTRGYWKGAPRAATVIRRHYRQYPALAESIITRHDRYNATREYVFELERQGHAYVFAPDNILVTNGTRNPALLNRAYEQGLEQARREIPAIRAFVTGDR